MSRWADTDKTFCFLEVFRLACGLKPQPIAHAKMTDIIRLVRTGNDKSFTGQNLGILDAGAVKRMGPAAVKLLVFPHQRLIEKIAARGTVEGDADFRLILQQGIDHDATGCDIDPQPDPRMAAAHRIERGIKFRRVHGGNRADGEKALDLTRHLGHFAG